MSFASFLFGGLVEWGKGVVAKVDLSWYRSQFTNLFWRELYMIANMFLPRPLCRAGRTAHKVWYGADVTLRHNLTAM